MKNRLGVVVLLVSAVVLGMCGVSKAAGPAYRLAFLSDRSGTTCLYTMLADGSNVVKLIDMATPDPSWSPDGSKIAFGGAGLNIAHVANGDCSEIARGIVRYPSWSPDGLRLAFTGEGLSQISTANDNGSDCKDFENPSWAKRGVCRRVQWSPDGANIAYEYIAAIDGIVRIAVLNLATGKAAIVATGSQPSWSPDGSKILLVGQDSLVSDKQGIITIAPNGKKKDVLVRNILGLDEFSYPRWAPDGKSIAYVNGALLKILDVASGRDRTVCGFSGLSAQNIQWSPDSSLVALELRPTGSGLQRSRIACVDLSTGSLQQLTNGGSNDTRPMWDPKPVGE